MKRFVFLAAASLILLLLLIPTEDIVCPEWDVLITDTDGRPVEGANVTVFSQQYTVESHDVEITKLTGSNGHVHFSARRLHSIGLLRLVGVIRNLGQGVHASFGVHTHLAASKAGYGDPSALDLFAQTNGRAEPRGQPSNRPELCLLSVWPDTAASAALFQKIQKSRSSLLDTEFTE